MPLLEVQLQLKLQLPENLTFAGGRPWMVKI